MGKNIIEVYGHRGCMGVLPENTLPSFAAAIKEGADALEMDLLVTKDGEIVIHHDYFLNDHLCTYLDGTPIEGRILIRDLTLEEIKKINCGCKRHHDYPSQQILSSAYIPTLEEVFILVKETHVRLILEIKREAEYPEYTFSPEFLAEKIAKSVKQSGLESRVYYSSFDLETLAEIRKTDSQAKIGLIQDRTLDGLIETAISLNAEIVFPKHSLLQTPENIKSMQDAGFRVIPWTVNNPDQWQKLIEMGVDGIVTDYPKDLITFIQNL